MGSKRGVSLTGGVSMGAAMGASRAGASTMEASMREASITGTVGALVRETTMGDLMRVT